MQRQLAPSSRLAQISPLVVPKYSPTGSRASPPWPGASPSTSLLCGMPLSSRCQLAAGIRVYVRRGPAADRYARPHARCRPSGTPSRSGHRADAPPSGSRCRRSSSACCRRCAAHCSRRAGRAGRCRSGSADRGGRGWTGTGARNADRASPGGRRESLPPLRGPRSAASRSRRGRWIRARRRSTSRCTGGAHRADRRCTECSFGPSGVPFSLRAHPLAVFGMLVEAGHAVPGVAAVLAAEQPLRRGAGVPRRPVRCACPGVSQNAVIDARAPSRPPSTFGNAGDCFASRQFAPPSSDSEDGGSEVPGLARHHECAAHADPARCDARCGPASGARPASRTVGRRLERIRNAPLRVPTSSARPAPEFMDSPSFELLSGGPRAAPSGPLPASPRAAPACKGGPAHRRSVPPSRSRRCGPGT